MAVKNPQMNAKRPQQHKREKPEIDTCTDEVWTATRPFWMAEAVRKGAGMERRKSDKNSWPTANEHTWGETASFTYYAVTPDNKHSTNQVECFKQLVFKQNSS